MKETRERTVGELAEVVKGRVFGDPLMLIRGIASIKEAQSGDITFAENRRFLVNAEQSSASAIIAPNGATGEVAAQVFVKTMIAVDNPRLAFAQILDLFAPEQYLARGIDPTAVIGSDFRCGANASIGAQSVLGENVRLGENVTIHALAYLGDDVEIGDNTVIGPHVTLLRGTVIGEDCLIHSGAVLGADGFGYLTIGGKHRKIPQIGHVLVGDHVEIGANVTIDRARTGATRIGSGTKIDNLVHIGHNCDIDEDCIIIAQVGLAGGVEIGHGAILGGQAGVKEQAKIGPGAVIGAQSGVMGDIPAGAFVSGYGARPHKEVLRTAASLSQLPDVLKKMREMEQRLTALEGENTNLKSQANKDA
ncbi:MAG: UDP-3-O-(3-hydroxymyristoyl)glucosamine N-acyltransferase [Cytophagales bacterium]|nr:UDP-3-O-(3-hydroxymyristoyl)glucosamine N-acyltransferase [Armatimonadota bacterium]